MYYLQESVLQCVSIPAFAADMKATTALFDMFILEESECQAGEKGSVWDRKWGSFKGHLYSTTRLMEPTDEWRAPHSACRLYSPFSSRYWHPL